MADGFTTTRSVPMPVRWGEKRYHSLDYALKSQFGEKVYRIALNGGMTCPNRDGKIGRGGCIFCSGMGSGDFAGSASFSICEQLAAGKAALQAKRPVHSYIAYFQAFTNTYAPVEYLEKIFTEAILDPDVRVLAVATRPDCLSHETVELLRRLNQIKPVWIELGLQHVILFLPGETEAQMLKTIDYLNCNPIDGIKLQLLHILKGTDLARDYARSPFHIPDMDEYIRCIGNCIAHLRPDIVIHRLTGDGPKDLLIEPQWTGAKRTVLNHIHQYLKKQDIWQGKEYYG